MEDYDKGIYLIPGSDYHCWDGQNCSELKLVGSQTNTQAQAFQTHLLAQRFVIWW